MLGCSKGIGECREEEEHKMTKEVEGRHKTFNINSKRLCGVVESPLGSQSKRFQKNMIPKICVRLCTSSIFKSHTQYSH